MFAVITLKVKQRGLSIEKFIQKVQIDIVNSVLFSRHLCPKI